MSTRALSLLFALFLLAGACIAADVPATPPSGAVDIFPLDQVKPGMKATGYTVFTGSTPEAFPLEVLGLLKNQWGPRQDIILVRVGGKAAVTGVAAGMSGSPVYIDGKLLGALSLRIGAFPNEAIGGVTPASLMIEIKDKDATRTAATARQKVPLPPEFRPATLTAGVSEPFLTPIETPLAFSGLSPEVLAPFAEQFRQAGITAVSGAGGSSITTAQPTTDPNELKRALKPGDGISGVLIAGDLAASVSGTVTYNDGQRVIAFGHPFMNFGQVDIPMAKADVVTVFGSSFQPFKIMNSTEVVGSVHQDRHSGILGVLGDAAHMIPVEATVRNGKGETTYHYQVFENPKLTPLLVMVACFNSLSGTNDYADEATYRVKAAIQMDGLPAVNMENLFANSDVPNAAPAPLGLSFWIGERFMRIFNNTFETPKISGVKFDIDVTPDRRTASIEQVTTDRTEVRPGEQVNLKVYLRPYRGERIVRDVQLTVPVTAPKGDVRITFSDPDLINRSNNLANASRLPGLNEVISLINREVGNGRLYVTMTEPAPTGYMDDKVMPQLPASVANVIDPGRSQNRLTLTGESVVLQEAIPIDYVISGNQTVMLKVK